MTGALPQLGNERAPSDRASAQRKPCKWPSCTSGLLGGCNVTCSRWSPFPKASRTSVFAECPAQLARFRTMRFSPSHVAAVVTVIVAFACRADLDERRALTTGTGGESSVTASSQNGVAVDAGVHGALVAPSEEKPPGRLEERAENVRSKAAPPAQSRGDAAYPPLKPMLHRSSVSNQTLQAALGQLFRGTGIPVEICTGRPVGIRVFGVRPSDALGLLGIKNGDRIESINGHPIQYNKHNIIVSETVQRLTRSALESAQATFLLHRRGRPISLLVSVRGDSDAE